MKNLILHYVYRLLSVRCPLLVCQSVVSLIPYNNYLLCDCVLCFPLPVCRRCS